MKGSVDPRFRAVGDAFERNFAERDELGAAVAVYLDGVCVVDAWGGIADTATVRPWEQDTLVVVFSATKGPIATAVAMLVDRGVLDYDRPVAEYWPGFAANGKQQITVGQVMSHSAGLSAIDLEIPQDRLHDRDLIVSALEAQEPIWEPGSGHGYHAVSIGWLADELIRRSDGRSASAFIAEEIAAPLGIEIYIGTPADVHPRVATVEEPPPPTELPKMVAAALDQSSITFRTTRNPVLGLPALINTEYGLTMELPAGNGVTNARSFARMYGALARGGEIDGVRLLSPETLAIASAPRVDGDDLVICEPTAYAYGFRTASATGPMAFSTNRRAFGHTGAGGSVAFADPDAKVGFAYVTNQMLPLSGSHDARATALVDAMYASLD